MLRYVRSQYTVNEYQRENIINLLDLKICAFLTFGCHVGINSPKQAFAHDSQHEHEIIFCITLVVGYQ